MDMDAPPLPEIREAYIAYTPPFDVAAVVQDLLSYVPAEFRRGLRYVLLRNAAGLSRRDLRQSIPFRGRWHVVTGCPGLYCRPYRGQPAHIVLHVDRILQRAPTLALGVSVYRDSHFAWVLYHEIGPPIHRAFHPRHREPEAIADDWAERLRNAMLRQKYRCLTAEDWNRLTAVFAKRARRRGR